MRRWDRWAASHADLYIANSEEVRTRIMTHYGVDAPVVHPPVDTARFRARERGERLLVVSRLMPYKRIEVIVEVATRMGLGLDVVGTGPSLNDLRRRAGRTVVFHGRVDDDAVSELMENCRALVVPGKEDFGITAIEANAAGKPVVAFAAGGALETLEEGLTGAFFHDHRPQGIIAAIERADQIDAPPEVIAANARRFSVSVFEVRLREVLQGALREQRERQPA
jgi:glycosyltransferase involved in cell wall biosynthesis